MNIPSDTNGARKPLLSLSRFEQDLADVLGSRLKIALPADGLVTAAVLVPLFRNKGRLYVLLTERSHQVEHHKGEISFPGGKMDPGDPDLRACALRETAEEVGLAPQDVYVVGELDDVYTVATGYRVVPFVGVIPYPYVFRPSAREIAGLLSVPLEVFFDPKQRREEKRILRGYPVQVVSYLWEGHNIWGATARILKHFVELMKDRWLLAKQDPACAER